VIPAVRARKWAAAKGGEARAKGHDRRTNGPDVEIPVVASPRTPTATPPPMADRFLSLALCPWNPHSSNGAIAASASRAQYEGNGDAQNGNPASQRSAADSRPARRPGIFESSDFSGRSA
jgi:hypothetical protein